MVVSDLTIEIGENSQNGERQDYRSYAMRSDPTSALAIDLKKRASLLTVWKNENFTLTLNFFFAKTAYFLSEYMYVHKLISRNFA